MPNLTDAQRAFNATAEGQLNMNRSADQRILDRCRTFNEIMTGPTPLTKDEIRRLIAKCPDVYNIFSMWTG